MAPTNNSPADNGNRDRVRERGDRGGSAPPSQMAPRNNPPADNNGDDRRNKKDRKNNRDNSY
jgi:hypothetical protein